MPITSDQLAADAQAVVALGVGALHNHPRKNDGAESLSWPDIESAIYAVRAVCPNTPIGISTGDWIEPNVEKRIDLISIWGDSVDFASVNFHEEGAVKVAQELMALNIGVEAGLFTTKAADNLVDSGLAEDCLRLMFEPIDKRLDDALNTVNTIEEILEKGGISNKSRLLHGFDQTAWPLLAEAKKRGYDSRIGLEDTLYLPDGFELGSNTELVQAALNILAA